MSTPDITQAEIANSRKFEAVKEHFTANALDLINRSETMKSMLRAYQESTKTDSIELWTASTGDNNRGAAQYRVPGPGNGESSKGVLSVGVDRISTATGLMHVLSHELGHLLHRTTEDSHSTREGAVAWGLMTTTQRYRGA